MVQRLLTRYSQASPAPERAPRAKNGQAAVGHIFEGQCWAVCFEPRASLGIPPEHSPTLGRSVGLTSLWDPKPATFVKSTLRLEGRECVGHTHRSPRFTCDRNLVSRRACVDGETRPPGETPDLAAAPTAALGCYRASLETAPPAGPRRRKSQRLKKRTRASRAATDDGRARQCRPASPHGRGGHG